MAGKPTVVPVGGPNAERASADSGTSAFAEGTIRRLFSDEPERASSDLDEAAKREAAMIRQGHQGGLAKRLEFFLSCMAYATGYGNIWRFPYLVYEFKGGVLIIPYLIFLVLVGIPNQILEQGIGQYLGLGPSASFGYICPLFRGVGYTCIFTGFLVTTYFNVLLAWMLSYLMSSMNEDVPWRTCSNVWNRDGCVGPCWDFEEKEYQFNRTCMSHGEFCEQALGPGSSANPGNASECSGPGGSMGMNTTAPAIDYFTVRVLGVFDRTGEMHTWDNYGKLRIRLFLCLFFGWAICMFFTVKQIGLGGRAAFLTCLLPPIMILFLMIHAFSLQHATQGKEAFVTFDFSELQYGDIWFRGAGQVFYTMGFGFGTIGHLAAYNKFYTNFIRDGFIISALNTSYSIMATFAVFAALGYIAFTLNKPVLEVLPSGTILMPISFSTLIGHLPAAVRSIVGTIVFVVLIIMGLDSQMTMFEAFTDGAVEQWPILAEKRLVFILFTGAICFLAGASMTFDGGIHLLILIDYYIPTIPVFVVAIFNSIVFVHLYGWNNLMSDWDLMVGRPQMLVERIVRTYLYICLAFISPILCVGLLVFFIVSGPRTSFGDYKYPPVVDAAGWCMAILVLLPIPIMAVKAILNCRKEGKPYNTLIQPTSNWLPSFARVPKSEKEGSIGRASFMSRISKETQPP